MSDHHDDHAHSHHVTSLPVLLATFGALVALTILTVLQATNPTIEGIIGSAEIYVTLLIATIKASLVALVFMQLAHDKPFNIIIVVSALVFVALFLGFTIIDSSQYLPDIREFRYDHIPQDAVPS